MGCIPCLMNTVQPKNVGKTFIPCCKSDKSFQHVPVAFKRLRQPPTARTRLFRGYPYQRASSCSSSAYSNNSHNHGCNATGPCGDAWLAGRLGVDALLRLWHRLCGLGAAAARVTLIAATLCIVSVLPRPAPSLAAPWRAPAAAAAAAAAAVAETPASSASADGPKSACSVTPQPRAPTSYTWATLGDGQSDHSILGSLRRPTGTAAAGMTEPGAIVPLAELSAAPLSGSASPDVCSSTTVTSAVQRSESRSISSSSINRGYDSAGPTSYSQDAAPYVSAGAPGGVLPSTSISSGGSGSGGLNGPAGTSSSSGVSGPAAVAAGPLPADSEEAALAQQLGIGLSEAGVIRLFERNQASVVNISGMRAMQTFTTLDLAKMPYGQGSGFIWGEKGHVVTCYHLVKGAAEVKVTLYDNTSYTAKVLGYDAAKNLAVLKLSIPKSKLRDLLPVAVGSAAGLRVGQSVYGIGNPWGLGHTLNRGLVSGLGLELSAGLFPLKGVIVSDSAPDPGSSGGVLLDSKGALVGMLVTPPASSGGGGGAVGRSFAVPIDAIRGLIAQILAYGRTVRPALGITMAPAQVLERVGVEGVLVLEVPPGSPAHSAGLRHTHRDIFGDLVLGDIIVGLDGKAVRSSSDVYDVLDEHRVGDRIKLDVVRDGKQTGLTITLGERLLGAVEE